MHRMETIKDQSDKGRRNFGCMYDDFFTVKLFFSQRDKTVLALFSDVYNMR